jgi:crotonobetainyl-CoA:carnitine CoA-transferase CaiB-like acyl-CoA transferase
LPESYEVPPSLGQHNNEILHGLGLDDGAIEAMKKDKVI